MLWWSALIIAILSFVVIGVGLVRERKKRKSGEIKYVPKDLVDDGINHINNDKGGE